MRKDSKSTLNFCGLYPFPSFSSSDEATFTWILFILSLFFLPPIFYLWSLLLPVWYLGQYWHCFWRVLKGLSDLSLGFIYVKLFIFAFWICFCTFYLFHILPTSLLNVNIMIVFVLFTTNISSKRVVIRHVKRCALATVMRIMYIMTLIHFPLISSRNHSCYSPSLIPTRMVTSAPAKGLLCHFQPYIWNLYMTILFFTIFPISRLSGFWMVQMLWWVHQW